MKIGMLGTGVVGQTLGTKLIAVGHQVMLGSRQAGNEKATEWASRAGDGASQGSLEDAARYGELVVNATAGGVSLDALNAAGAGNLAGKVLVDVANPLDASKGFPPTLTICNTDSLAETIQRTFPDTFVVKTLNTVNADVMVDPAVAGGSTTIFICGNDEQAKATVAGLLQSFGWAAGDILDLGDIGAARGVEMYLPLWIRLWGAAGTGHLNVKVVVGS